MESGLDSIVEDTRMGRTAYQGTYTYTHDMTAQMGTDGNVQQGQEAANASHLHHFSLRWHKRKLRIKTLRRNI
jgi:hypothetical protein